MTDVLPVTPGISFAPGIILEAIPKIVARRAGLEAAFKAFASSPPDDLQAITLAAQHVAERFGTDLAPELA